jgi:O-antigen/teichoic acid export membrane protein
VAPRRRSLCGTRNERSSLRDDERETRTPFGLTTQAIAREADRLRDDDDEGLGARFWFGIMGATIAFGIGLIVLFFFISMVWYAWGIIGALLVLFFGIGLIGWIQQRRAQKEYDSLA